MDDSPDHPQVLDLPALEAALRRVEPAAMLLPSWLLENVIAADFGIGGPLFSMPHGRSHVISRDRLMRLASDEELPLPTTPPEQPTLLLLVRPDNDWLSATPAGDALLAYWRLLFHAAIDATTRD